jgi:hypothetical protein
MKLREKLRLLVLTREEQRTIAFIVLALVLGIATQHYRHTHQRGETPNGPATASGSPSPSPRR